MSLLMSRQSQRLVWFVVSLPCRKERGRQKMAKLFSQVRSARKTPTRNIVLSLKTELGYVICFITCFSLLIMILKLSCHLAPLE